MGNNSVRGCQQPAATNGNLPETRVERRQPWALCVLCVGAQEAAWVHSTPSLRARALKGSLSHSEKWKDGWLQRGTACCTYKCQGRDVISFAGIWEAGKDGLWQ